MELTQLLDALNLGLLTLDRELCVGFWNRWLEERSGIQATRIVGQPLLESFPSLDTPRFRRSVRAVMTLGNSMFFPVREHGFLLPLPPSRTLGERFEHMQQSCKIGPLRDRSGAIAGVYLTVEDVTEMASYQRQLQRMTTTDALTGVCNRGHCDERLREEFTRSRRYARPLSVLIFDVDHFKRINDTHGHPVGDAVLVAVAQALRGSLRATDLVARFGGEEFCCLLPETGYAEAKGVAERLRQAVAELEVHAGEAVVRATASAGVASLLASMTAPEELVASADKALYAAKHGGRNRVAGAQG